MRLYWLAHCSAWKAYRKQFRKRLTELRRDRAEAPLLDKLDRM
jgi:hypothetical protein